MKKIIAATDFSLASVNAVNYAAEMAKIVNAELLLVNAYTIPLNYAAGVAFSISVEELKADSERELETIRQELLYTYGENLKVSTEAFLGNIIDVLMNLCKSQMPFAVVIGMRGKSNLERTLFGTSAMSVIKHLTVPVICIPPGKKYGEGIHRIGLACDFKNVNETMPDEPIRDFLKSFNAELHILNVDYREKRLSSGSQDESFVLHQMFLDLQPEYHYVENEDTEKGINDFTKAFRLDMLITIPKKHKLMERIFRKSITPQLIHDITVPLMSIHQ
jgi:nucleotide-binding universal stress UspA family protein